MVVDLSKLYTRPCDLQRLASTRPSRSRGHLGSAKLGVLRDYREEDALHGVDWLAPVESINNEVVKMR